MPREQLCGCATLKCCFGTSPDLQLPYCLKRPSSCTRSAFRGADFLLLQSVAAIEAGAAAQWPDRPFRSPPTAKESERRSVFASPPRPTQKSEDVSPSDASSSRQAGRVSPAVPRRRLAGPKGGTGAPSRELLRATCSGLCEAFCTPGLTPRLFRKGVPQHVLSHPLGNAETSRISDYNPNPARRRPHKCRRSRVHERPRLHMHAVNYKISHTAIYSLGSLQARQTCTSSDCHSMKIGLLVRT